MEEINGLMPEGNVEYTEDNIRHLDDMEHIRVRSGMYIGRLGDGTQNDDGIYVLLKEVMDNSIDEFKMGAGKRIEISIEENLRVSVRDYGRGIPQGKLIEAVSKLNTGGKYDSKAFKKSVGLNGVGIKAVNALSNRFEVRSYREGKVRIAIFEKGILQGDVTENSDEESGTYIFFEPDSTLFLNYSFQANFVEMLLRNYTYLNTGLSIIYNGQRIISRHGLEDLLNDNMTAQGLYNILHLKGEDIEIAFTHTTNTEKNITPSSTDSIRRKAVHTKVHSKNILPAPSRNFITKTRSTPISVTVSLPPLPLTWKNPSSRDRQKPNSVRLPCLRVV